MITVSTFFFLLAFLNYWDLYVMKIEGTSPNCCHKNVTAEKQKLVTNFMSIWERTKETTI